MSYDEGAKADVIRRLILPEDQLAGRSSSSASVSRPVTLYAPSHSSPPTRRHATPERRRVDGLGEQLESVSVGEELAEPLRVEPRLVPQHVCHRAVSGPSVSRSAFIVPQAADLVARAAQRGHRQEAGELPPLDRPRAIHPRGSGRGASARAATSSQTSPGCACAGRCGPTQARRPSEVSLATTPCTRPVHQQLGPRSVPGAPERGDEPPCPTRCFRNVAYASVTAGWAGGSADRRVGPGTDTLQGVQLPVMPPVAPMLAKPAAAIPPGQFYKPKWDDPLGRVPRRRRGGDRQPQGAADDAVLPGGGGGGQAGVPARAVIDGEIVIAGETGLDFGRCSSASTRPRAASTARRGDPRELRRLRPARPR